MSGYRQDYSMSNRAHQAYHAGEKPISKWTKSDILYALKDHDEIVELRKLTLAQLKAVALVKSSWHHTSSRYNVTNFYSIDYGCSAKNAPPKAVKAKAVEEEAVRVSFIEDVWEGTKRYPKKVQYERAGLMKNGWIIDDYGNKYKVGAKKNHSIKEENL